MIKIKFSSINGSLDFSKHFDYFKNLFSATGQIRHFLILLSQSVPIKNVEIGGFSKSGSKTYCSQSFSFSFLFFVNIRIVNPA